MKIKFGKLYNLKIQFYFNCQESEFQIFSKKLNIEKTQKNSKILFHNFYKIFFEINKLEKKHIFLKKFRFFIIFFLVYKKDFLFLNFFFLKKKMPRGN